MMSSAVLRATMACLVVSSLVGNPAQAEVVGKKFDIQNIFSPSGWMGDGEYGRDYVKFLGADTRSPHSPPHSVRVKYTFGKKRWAGIYWLNRPDNWGDKKGHDFSKSGISRLTFWARGARGGEIIEFKSGYIDSPRKKYRDSYGATTGRVTLSKEWKRYEIDLADENLKSVIGGFCWVASADFNPVRSISFYIDDIAFE